MRRCDLYVKALGYGCNNRVTRRKLFRRFRRKCFAAVLGMCIVASIASSAGNTTAVAIEFATKTVTEWKESIVQKFAGDTAKAAQNGDYTTKEGVEKVVEDVANRAETFANENGTEFSRASISRVVDGDTIVVDIFADNCGDKSHEYTVRLIGVNTPESVASQEYLEYKGTTNSEEGKAASDYTKELLQDIDYVYLESDVGALDKYGRSLYYVWFDVPSNEYDIDEVSNHMLNGLLVKEGYAEVATYKPNVKYADYFAAIEARTTDDFAVDR